MDADHEPPFWCFGKMNSAGLDPRCNRVPIHTRKDNPLLRRHHLRLAPAFGAPPDLSIAHSADNVNLIPLDCNFGGPCRLLGLHLFAFACERCCIRMARKLVQAREECPQGLNNFFSMSSQWRYE